MKGVAEIADKRNSLFNKLGFYYYLELIYINLYNYK